MSSRPNRTHREMTGEKRYVWQYDRDGTKMGMGGVYREIKAPERIAS